MTTQASTAEQPMNSSMRWVRWANLASCFTFYLLLYPL